MVANASSLLDAQPAGALLDTQPEGSVRVLLRAYAGGHDEGGSRARPLAYEL
jgi:hypothetical protein